jgi:hypothetical protein
MPLKFFTAFTSPFNPSGASPVITHDQAWKAMIIKADKPQAFVPVIASSETISRSDTGLVRKMAFVPGKGPSDIPVTEEVEFIGNMRVRFTFGHLMIV